MRKAFTRFAAVLFFAGSAALFLAVWLVTTDSGLRWLVSFGKTYVPGELTIERIDGRLIGPLEAQNLAYRHDGVTVTAEHINIDWLSTALITGTAHIKSAVADNVSIIVRNDTSSIDNASAISLPDIRFPLRIKLDDLKVTNLTIIQGERPVVVNRIRLSARTTLEQFQIDTLEVLTDTLDISLHGTIIPFGSYRHELVTTWQLSLPDTLTISGQGEIAGTVDSTRIHQNVREPFPTDLDLTVNALVDHPHWRATVRSAAVDIRKIDPSWPPMDGNVDISGSGTFTDFETHGHFDTQYDARVQLHGEFALSGNDQGTLHVAKLNVTRPDTPGLVQFTGTWLPDGESGRIDADVAWQHVAWPMINTPLIESPAGRLRISGSLNEYSVIASGDLKKTPIPKATDTQSENDALVVPADDRATFPPLTFALTGHGTGTEIVIPDLSLNTLGGRVLGNVTIAWRPEVAWSATMRGKNLDPGGLNRRWPGQISVIAESSGRLSKAGLLAEIKIASLSGTVRDRSFHMDGGVSINGQTIQILDSQLVSGQSQLKLSGRVDNQLDVRWNIRSPDLQDLHPDAKGSLNGVGTLTGDRRAPLLSVDLDGHKLAYHNNTIANIRGTAAVNLVEWTIPNIQLSADRITAMGIDFDTVHVEGGGTRQSGGVTVLAVTTIGTVVAKATSQTLNDETTITLERADALITDGGEWRLDHPGEIVITPETLTSRHLCWSQTEGAGSGCLHAGYAAQRWSTSASFDAVPLQPFSIYFPEPPIWNGKATLRLGAEKGADQPISGDFSVRLSGGELTYPLSDGETGTWRYDHGEIDGKLGLDGLVSNLLVRMENGDSLDAQVALPGFNPATFDGAHQAVRGSINARVGKTAIIDLLIPEVQQSQGNITVAIALGGTIDAMRIDGRVGLRDGQFLVPRLGLTISELVIDGGNLGTESFRYRVSARSGDGVIHVSGVTKLDATAGWPTELQITGSDFELSRIPEARINVSPDIQVKIAKHVIYVDGQITVPYARLEPKDHAGTVTVSEDEIIIGVAPEPGNPWKIYTKVRVIIGDRVSLYGFGFEGRIVGNLLLNDRPGEVTTASGELSVAEGRYRAYGQRLIIERGLLLFAGGPVSNPGLELRAVRHVDNVTAGIRVAGTLRTPLFEVFSTPAMGETDALSYLVLGRPLESGSSEDARVVAQAALVLSLKGGDFLARRIGDRFGLEEMRIETADTGDQASLVIGRYLSPRLYVSYGVGLIDAINTFNARYELSRHWQLRAESGRHQSTDAVYTIER
ncbi:MAG: hypothetical protein FD165_292 [Gammaproteobacteria bacterium]|nr:MAG: hypothetical protein FD165_292 [Gammaproteobacteria bacterium]TND06871.1 MAG: hypothetical protein FD120_603 [Gammaproteobacteria bacterium]